MLVRVLLFGGVKMSESTDLTPKTRRRRWLITLVVFAAVLIIARPLAIAAMLWRAESALNSRKHSAAVRWLKVADWIDGENAETHFLLARGYRRLEEFEKFEDHFKQAERLGWEFKLLQREHLIALGQLGKYEQLNPYWSELFREAGSDGPEISRAFVTGCLVHLRLADARKVLDAWTRDYPDDPEPRFLNGRIAESVMLWQDAKTYYAACLKLDPTHEQARLGLAKCEMAIGRFDLANDEIAQVLESSPDSNEARSLRAQCLEKLGETDEAVSLLRQVVKSDPKHVDALKTLGNLLLTQKEPDEALAYLERAYDLTPEDSSARFPLAKAYKAVGRTEEAKPHFDFVEEATKPLIRLGRLTSQVQEEPENPDLRYQIGMIAWKYQSRDTGVRWFRSILSLEPGHKKTHLALAEHFDVTGETDLATHHRELANR